MDSAPAPRLLSRRRMLRTTGLAGLTGMGVRAGLGVGATLGLGVGCSVSDPRIDGGQEGPAGRTGSASGSPASTSPASPSVPGAESGARAEASAAALASALLSSKAGLTSGQRQLIGAARDAHRLHSAVLLTPDPTARSTSGATTPPTLTQPTKVSLAALIAAERSLATRHARVVPSTRGLTALLFGSLSVSGSTYASALAAKGAVPIRKTAADPPAPDVLDDVAGTQAVVEQLHALIYGYQVAIGRLSVGSKDRDRALAGLTERRTLRDRLTLLLLSRKASVPAAEPAYVTSPKVRSAASASALIASMETAFVPFTGQWLAATARPVDQQLAWSTMRRAASLARSWGGPVSAWPGWPL